MSAIATSGGGGKIYHAPAVTAGAQNDATTVPPEKVDG